MRSTLNAPPSPARREGSPAQLVVFALLVRGHVLFVPPALSSLPPLAFCSATPLARSPSALSALTHHAHLKTVMHMDGAQERVQAPFLIVRQGCVERLSGVGDLA